MRVYIAGRFTNRRKLRNRRRDVRELGIECVSGWLDIGETNAVEKDVDRDEWQDLALRDLDDVKKSDMIILDLEKSGGGGRFFEAGLAYAYGKIYVTVGECVSIFDALASRNFEDWEEVLEWLTTIRTTHIRG